MNYIQYVQPSESKSGDKIFNISNLKSLEKFATYLSEKLFPGCALFIDGPLGIGKTTLIRSILERWNIKSIGSPTFSKVITYQSKLFNKERNSDLQNDSNDSRSTDNESMNNEQPVGSEFFVWHSDAYNMENTEYLKEYLFEFEEGILIVEWSELIPYKDLWDSRIEVNVNEHRIASVKETY
ncbi:tRNA (adenosine(37)-N6)-threonylcarbamoyltransferase complex ATPase subunit type 1 TsaE [Candidatus Nesciobacter abundans]|uniref:tRNA (Adenosine(37)-N6)-threonylcarbamoyltransferase complex ATPase subunit type 1 TsaE n=1 Tax=Candidatus Nesciobacter abundans TaxID=2601668 RepID=A0A5C0UFZ7_9PROT|nr:tRNA (adenosine(37)-N6)-threonylcarbamoyltransferase complex ATPase subunit type 1 TsaE [Candidatus Nesciobacter abundans]QEK38978.1 tRNA (adenosine(37)-N6)-threonylcarbamoyltransferase complex ATPase subunit type 1 TsaE [Candidatus Nesciobacter abundans]